MRYAMKMMLVIVAMGSLVNSASAQLFEQPPLGDAVPVFDSREAKVAWINNAVAEYNAMAAKAPRVNRAGEVSATGEAWQPHEGPAAWTVWNPNARGVLDICRVDVAVLGAESQPAVVDDVSFKLLSDFRIASVTFFFDPLTVTPTFSQTAGFDATLTWSNFPFADEVALGNLLSKLTRFGRGVVVAMFTMQEAIPGLRLGGAFAANQEYCITPVAATAIQFTGFAGLGTVHVPGSPLMEGVTTFDGGSGAWRSSGALHPNATRIASWSTGEILVATRFDLQGRRVDLGFYPPSNDVNASSWDTSTDGVQLMTNALVYAGNCPNVGEAPGCGPALFSQTDPALNSSATSNTPINTSPQQSADDFTLPNGGSVHAVTIWGHYGNVPQAQHFVVNFFDDVGGLPGNLIHTTVAVGVPEYTGLPNTREYRVVLRLPVSFMAAPGVKYWVSPLADTPETGAAEVIWLWVGDELPGSNGVAFRGGSTGPWDFSVGAFAFELCGFCNCGCPGDNDFDGDVDLDDLQLLLFAFGVSCR